LVSIPIYITSQRCCVETAVLSLRPGRSPGPRPGPETPQRPLPGLRRALAWPFCVETEVLSLAAVRALWTLAVSVELSLVEISGAQIFPLTQTQGRYRRPSPEAAFVKIKDPRRFPPYVWRRRAGLIDPDVTWLADPFAARVKKLTALRPIRYNIQNTGKRA
jgi:hypothetical protein